MYTKSFQQLKGIFIRVIIYLIILLIIAFVAIYLKNIVNKIVEGFDKPPKELRRAIQYVMLKKAQAEYLEVSQIAVYTLEDPNTNIAPTGFVKGQSNDYYGLTNAQEFLDAPIDGVLENRDPPSRPPKFKYDPNKDIKEKWDSKPTGFISRSDNHTGIWSLNLGKGYAIGKIVYYSLKNYNPANMYIQLLDSDGQSVWSDDPNGRFPEPYFNGKLTSDMIQTWTFTIQGQPAPAPETAPETAPEPSSAPSTAAELPGASPPIDGPIIQASSASAPQGPITSAPITSAPITSAPITSAPITSAPSSPSENELAILNSSPGPSAAAGAASPSYVPGAPKPNDIQGSQIINGLVNNKIYSGNFKIYFTD